MSEREEFLLLINQGGNKYFPEDCTSCVIKPCFSRNTKFHRVMRKFIFKCAPICSFFLFRSWIQDAAIARVIVVFDGGNAAYITRYLARKFPQKRIILYYWNPVSRSINPSKIDINNVEIWSFDRNDCDTYNFRYNPQFFFPENAVLATSPQLEYDGVFVGVDKQRSTILQEIKAFAEKQGLNFYFYLVKSNLKSDLSEVNQKYNERITYEELIHLVNKSKAIIDVCSSDQTGMTLRPLEALFLKKKLITNMKKMVEYSLYNRKNVFIIGQDDYCDLYDFVNSPYDESDHEKLLAEYGVENWLNRFNDSL